MALRITSGSSRLLGDLDDIESSVTHAKETPARPLRIDAGAAISTFHHPAGAADFLAKYPDIAVEFGVSDRPADLIGDNVDCVIRGGPLLDPSLVARHIGDLRWVTCATPAYLAKHGTATHPTDLETGHVLAGYFFPRSGRMRPLIFQRDGKRIEMPPNPRVAVNDSGAHFVSLRAGLGLGQIAVLHGVRAAARTNELDSGAARTGSPTPMPVHVLYPANRHLSTKVRVFVDWVAGALLAKPVHCAC